MTSANTMRLEGLMFGLLGWVNWGLSWHFSGAFAGSSVVSWLRVFFSVLAFWGFNSLLLAKN